MSCAHRAACFIYRLSDRALVVAQHKSSLNVICKVPELISYKHILQKFKICLFGKSYRDLRQMSMKCLARSIFEEDGQMSHETVQTSISKAINDACIKDSHGPAWLNVRACPTCVALKGPMLSWTPRAPLSMYKMQLAKLED